MCRYAIETNQTSAKFCDGSGLKEPFSGMPSNKTRRGCCSQTKVHLTEEHHCVTQLPRKRSLSKQESYVNDYGTQQGTQYWVCPAKDHGMKTCPYTVFSGELAQKREADYKQVISFGSRGNNRRGFHNSGCYTDRNHNQKYYPGSKVSNQGRKSADMQLRLLAIQQPHNHNQAVRNSSREDRPNV